MGEEIKIKPIIEKYLIGTVADIGCGNSKITPEAFGIDGRDLPGVDFITDGLYGLKDKLLASGKPVLFDTVFSSHCAEHLPDMWKTVDEWSDLVKQGGHIIFYLPNSGDYNNYDNPEHFHDTEYKSFLFWITQSFCGKAKDYKGEQFTPAKLELIESGLDNEKEGHYSFYCVLKKS